jgi:hypothetical protein
MMTEVRIQPTCNRSSGGTRLATLTMIGKEEMAFDRVAIHQKVLIW